MKTKLPSGIHIEIDPRDQDKLPMPLRKVRDFVMSFGVGQVVILGLSLLLLYTCVLSGSEYDLEEDFYNNEVLQRNTLVKLKKPVDINAYPLEYTPSHQIMKMDIARGYIVLLVTWSMNDCPTCPLELERIRQFASRIPPEIKVKVIAVADHTSKPSDVFKLFNEKKLASIYAFHSQKKDLFQALNVEGFPRYFIVNKEGVAFAEIKTPIFEDNHLYEPLFSYSLMDKVVDTNYDPALLSKLTETKK